MLPVEDTVATEVLALDQVPPVPDVESERNVLWQILIGPDIKPAFGKGLTVSVAGAEVSLPLLLVAIARYQLPLMDVVPEILKAFVETPEYKPPSVRLFQVVPLVDSCQWYDGVSVAAT